MAKIAVIKTGGKQYIVRENEELIVNKLDQADNEKFKLETMAVYNEEDQAAEVGTPFVKAPVEAQIIAQVKGDKIRISRFKSKVRFRKLRGFRPQYTKIKILSI
jgi:large subunit ribosomal protein L21